MSKELKELLGDDLYNQVLAKSGGKKIDLISDSNYVRYDRFHEVIGEKNELKSQISELTGQLGTLKSKAKGNEEFEAEITKYKEANEAWEKKYNTGMMNKAIESEAMLAKARNASDILAFINRDELVFDQEKGKIKGLNSQLVELKKNKPYLFDLKEEQASRGTQNPAGAKDDDSDNWGNLLDGFISG